MKIAIITITDGANYGNRLQNFAMQELLKSLGNNVETIQRKTKRDIKGIEKSKYYIKEYVKKFLGKKNTSFYRRKRTENFNEFNEKYIVFSEEILSENTAPVDFWENYDYFVCGSDQIWNTSFEIITCDVKNYLASFAKPSQRIAFAASFGTNHVNSKYIELFSEELKKFKSIAVREDVGKTIVENLTGRKDVQVVLDPTLLLKKEQWEKIEEKPSYIGNKKFAVTYFLGGINKEMNQYIDEMAHESHAEVINLDIEFLLDSNILNKDFFETSPSEFIWLIHHAEFVLTDSFHAAVFSVIFRRPFLVFERLATEENNDMSSRIATLLERFDLTDCRDEVSHPTKKPRSYDCFKIDEILQNEHEKAIEFLTKALM